MTKYTCSACNQDKEDPPCILEVGECSDTPAFCPYRYEMEDEAHWQRVAPAQALQSEEMIQSYTLRARMKEINNKEDVNEVIQELSDCITDLVSIDWPEDIELKSRIKAMA